MLLRPVTGELLHSEGSALGYTRIMGAPAYEEIDHTADWALRVTGADLASLLRNAALGMLQLAGAEPAESPQVERTLTLTSHDRESLLVDWLEELLFALETREVTVFQMELSTTGQSHLEARIVEVPVLKLSKHIKAVTYNELRIEEIPQGLTATIVFDV